MTSDTSKSPILKILSRGRHLAWWLRHCLGHLQPISEGLAFMPNSGSWLHFLLMQTLGDILTPFVCLSKTKKQSSWEKGIKRCLYLNKKLCVLDFHINVPCFSNHSFFGSPILTNLNMNILPNLSPGCASLTSFSLSKLYTIVFA